MALMKRTTSEEKDAQRLAKEAERAARDAEKARERRAKAMEKLREEFFELTGGTRPVGL